MSDFIVHDFTSPYSHLPWIPTAVGDAGTGFEGFRAFKTVSDRWISSGFSNPWLKIDCGLGFTGILTSYSVGCGSGGNVTQSPQDWTMQGSNDDSSWDVLDTVTGQTSWSTSQIRSFTPATQTTAYRFFRIVVTAANGSSFVSISAVAMTGTVSTPQYGYVSGNAMTTNSAPSPYVAAASTAASTFDAFKAFNGIIAPNGSNRWVATAGTGWVSQDIGPSLAGLVQGYILSANAASNGNNTPNSWTLEGSNDNSTWNVLDTVSGQTWGDIVPKVFICDTVSSSYRYFRINISASNGGSAVTVEELYLLGSTAPPSHEIAGTTGGVVGVRGGVTGRITITNSGSPLRGGIGGQVGVRGGKTGAIFLANNRLFTVFIAGIDVTAMVMIGVNRVLTIGGGSKASCTFKLSQKPVTYRPELGAEVVIWMHRGNNPYTGGHGPYRWFAGIVNTVSDYDYTGAAALGEITVNCIDYGAICDRIIVGREYQSREGNLGSILFNQVCTQYLLPTWGINYVFTGDPEIALGDQVYNWITATEVFNQITQATNWEWRVDFYKELLYFSAIDGYLTAPFSIEDNDGNWIDMTVTRDAGKYLNHVGVRNSANNRPLWTDTRYGDNQTRIWATMSRINTTPIIKVNGIPQVVVHFTEIGTKPYDFNWTQDGVIVQNFSHPLLQASDTILISYLSPVSYIAWSPQNIEGDVEIAENGLFEGIVEVKDISNIDTLQALADSIYMRRKIKPASAVFQTDKDGLEPGMMIPINTTRPLLNEPMMITQVSSTEIGKGAFFRHTVTCQNSANQAISNPQAFYQNLIARTVQPKDRVRQNVVVHLAESIEGYINPGLTVGLKPSATRT